MDGLFGYILTNQLSRLFTLRISSLKSVDWFLHGGKISLNWVSFFRVLRLNQNNKIKEKASETSSLAYKDNIDLPPASLFVKKDLFSFFLCVCFDCMNQLY